MGFELNRIWSHSSGINYGQKRVMWEGGGLLPLAYILVMKQCYGFSVEPVLKIFTFHNHFFYKFPVSPVLRIRPRAAT